MKECDRRIVGSGPRAFVDETDVSRLERLESGGKITDGVRDVVKALAALLDELRDGRIRAGGLEEFEPDGAFDRAERVERDANLLIGNRLHALEPSAEDSLIEIPLHVQRPDRDSDVIDALGLDHERSPKSGGRTFAFRASDFAERQIRNRIANSVADRMIGRRSVDSLQSSWFVEVINDS